MLLTLLLGFLGFLAILGFVLLSVVFMAYKAQAPGKGYVSEVEQVFWIALGFTIGATLIGLILGWSVLAASLTFVLVFCTSVVVFGLT
jgi:hypothetical protein